MKSRRQDTKSENVDKLKEANKKLRSNNRQLKKELRKALEYVETVKELLEDEGEDLLEVVPIKQEPACPICNSEVTEVSAGQFMIQKCKSCTWRKRV